MQRKSLSRLVAITLIAMFAATGGVIAGEHPAEHPKEGKKGKSKVTKQQLAKKIENYVENEAKLKGGYFLVYDKKAKETLALTLEKVHKKRLATIGKGQYFACADFKATNGKVYDLDIFMNGPNANHLNISQITVHKEDGKARYTWYQEDGLWKTKSTDVKPAKGEKKHHEHPGDHDSEHPSEHPK